MVLVDGAANACESSQTDVTIAVYANGELLRCGQPRLVIA